LKGKEKLWKKSVNLVAVYLHRFLLFPTRNSVAKLNVKRIAVADGKGINGLRIKLIVKTRKTPKKHGKRKIKIIGKNTEREIPNTQIETGNSNEKGTKKEKFYGNCLIL
jgi:hypothetical protein